MIAIPIGPRMQRYATAATPAFLDRHGRPRHPRDLLKHACIRHRFASGRIAAWEFERAGKPLRISPDGPLVGGGLDLELGAALQHLGLIQSFEHFLRPRLQADGLEEVLADWSVSFAGPFLYHASRRHLPAPLRAFVDFLKGQPA